MPGEDGPIPVLVGHAGQPVMETGSADDIYADGETREGAAQRVLQVARDSYTEGLDLARRCASQAMRRLGDLGEGMRPDEIELQVSITLDAGMAAVVKAGAEAQLQVTFRWQPGREDMATATATRVAGPASAPAAAPGADS
ncbi:CU044_2847 family protein [Streptomyces sp. NPDC001514]